MITTLTRAITDTYTEARARYVMGKVFDHLISLCMRGIITKAYADEIRSDILYLLDRRAVTFFELQFKYPNGNEIGGLHYAVRADASISIDTDSGGVDFWSLPQNTQVNLLVQLNRNSIHIAEVDKQIAEWGWVNGTSLAGVHQPKGSFSKEGFGLKQSIVGIW
jgi:hypothetical protein